MRIPKGRYIIFCVSCLLMTIVATVLAMLGAVSGDAPRAYAMSFTPLTPVATSTVGVSAYVTPGVLSMHISSLSGSGSTALNGHDGQEDFDVHMTVNDTTNSGAGWDLTVSMTQFDNGGHKLSTSAVSVIGVTENNCNSDSCTNPSNSVSYTLPVPSNGSTATKFYNAAANTGMGNFTIDPTFEVSIPDTSYAGTYSSSMAISITSGP